jgi:hypothetical protein
MTIPYLSSAERGTPDDELKTTSQLPFHHPAFALYRL